MKQIVLHVSDPIAPFGEPARDLRILNKPLWLLQRDLLSRYCDGTYSVDGWDQARRLNLRGELVVHKDNLFFNDRFLEAFLSEARRRGRPVQAAFALDDPAITTHALRLQEGIRRRGDVYVADFFYFPDGLTDVEPEPLVIDTEPQEMGYYHIPTYMANERGDLVFQVPLRAFLSVEHWVHVFMANSPFGVFSWARALEYDVERSWRLKAKIFLRSLLERKHFLSTSALVKVGKNCSIDPSAVIQGPTVIGNNVHIGAGAVIVSSLIGDNVNIMQGAQVLLSVVSDRCYLPFRASLFMTSFMEDSMVAQNSTLQLCVVGRNTFIGAGVTFTDFNLLGDPIRTYYKGRLEEVGLPVLGSAVGHNCRIGSGFVFYPARMVESGTILIYSGDHAVIRKNVGYDQGHQHFWRPGRTFPPEREP